MSHLKERKEKICLNCHTALSGRYCHICGQENLEPKETVWHLVLHFFNDITHFDGKFFSTVKYLIRKPGFLSKEYVAGRRASYLNPIRMYVFTSAIFFLVLFSLKKPDDLVNMNMNITPEKPEIKKELSLMIGEEKKLEEKLANTTDEEDKQDLQVRIDKRKEEISAIKTAFGDTTTRMFSSRERKEIVVKEKKDSLLRVTGIKETDTGYRYKNKDNNKNNNKRSDKDNGNREKKDSLGTGNMGTANSDGSKEGINSGKDTLDMNMLDFLVDKKTSVETYDSAQLKLPEDQRDGWIKAALTRKIIVARDEFHHDRRRYFEHFTENFLHSFPKILFFSLPFFALILNILYFRRKKEFYYVDHGIFTIHVYCATFILILVTLLLQKLAALLVWKWFTILTSLAILFMGFYIMIYLYKAMRGFYGQGRVKTFIKYTLTCFLAFIVNMILLIFFILISAITI